MAEKPADWAAAACLENFRQYRDLTTQEVERVRRNLNGLSDDDKASLVRKPEEQLKAMEEAVAATLSMIEKLEEVVKKEAETAERGRNAGAPVGTKPVQTLLHTFVREWSAEGAQERQSCFDRVLGALDKHLDKAGRVLIPACSLGRLALEVAGRGHSVETCEGRLLHWFGLELLRQTSSVEAFKPQPFALNTCNRLKFVDNHRVTPVPEIAIKEGQLPRARFGEFTVLYGKSKAKESFDCLLTAYALDLSPNVFRFVRTAAHILRPGGVWANFGPLAYDTDHDEAIGHGLELSWEEIKFALSHFFDIQEEEWIDALHAQNAQSLMQMQYTCIFFKATRNSAPVPMGPMATSD